MSNNVMATCIHCELNRGPRDIGPCPRCGRTGRRINVTINEPPIRVTDRISISRTRQYYEKNPKLTGVLIAIWLGGIIVGYFVGGTLGGFFGGLIGSIAFVLPPSTTRVIQRDNFS